MTTSQTIRERYRSTDPQDGPYGEAQLRRQLRVFLGFVGAAAALFAAIEGVVAVIYGERIVAIAALALCGCGLWLLRARSQVGHAPLGRLVARLTTVLFAGIILNGLIQPTGQAVVALAALVPVIVALPFLDRPATLRAMAMAWTIAMVSIVFGVVSPRTAFLPPEANSLLQVGMVGLTSGLLFVLLWQFGNRLKDSIRDLRTLTRMSSELTQTLDLKKVGDVAARHMAHALGVDTAGICYWDRATDTLLTYGFYPPDSADIAAAYDLADYPLSRRIMEDRSLAVVSMADPAADSAEVAYLRSIGQSAMMMIPLVARGRTLGIVELTTKRAHAFPPAQVALARMLAEEASMALDNARLYEELRHQAHHDAVTDLANQVSFREQLGEALARPDGEGSVALLFIDLDDFKEVNDRFGHTTGDELLRGVAARLRSVLRPDDLAARFGGDEFAILLTQIDEVSAAERVAQRIVDALAQPFLLAGRSVRVAASVGVATSAVSGPNVDELLRDADFAMYRAKAAGKNRFATFVRGMREEAA